MIDRTLEASAIDAQVLRLTEENEALRRQVNAYAYQRDCAREERDKAERRSENFWRPQKEAANARIKALEEALSHALDHYDRSTCLHESVHRGGSIWTICDDCGRQWADDKGGFQPHVDPTEISAARTALKGDQP